MISLKNNHVVDINGMVFNGARAANGLLNHFRDVAKMVGNNNSTGVSYE